MSISGRCEMTGDRRLGSAIARKRRIKQRLSVASACQPEQAPSVAGWAVYVASAAAFVTLCLAAMFK